MSFASAALVTGVCDSTVFRQRLLLNGSVAPIPEASHNFGLSDWTGWVTLFVTGAGRSAMFRQRLSVGQPPLSKVHT